MNMEKMLFIIKSMMPDWDIRIEQNPSIVAWVITFRYGELSYRRVIDNYILVDTNMTEYQLAEEICGRVISMANYYSPPTKTNEIMYENTGQIIRLLKERHGK